MSQLERLSSAIVVQAEGSLWLVKVPDTLWTHFNTREEALQLARRAAAIRNVGIVVFRQDGSRESDYSSSSMHGDRQNSGSLKVNV